MAAEILVRGRVSRALPQPDVDGVREGQPFRLSRYDEATVQPVVRKAHLLADEGTYFVVNNAQTGIIEGVKTAFTAVNPTCIVANNDSPSSPTAKRIYMDYVDLTVSTAGVTATAVTAKWAALVIDNTNRYSSAGTDISSKIVCPNMDAKPASVAQVVFGALTAAAATAAARTIVGQRLIRMPVTATTAPDVIGDRLRFEFGSVESLPSVAIGSTGALQANVMQECLKIPPVVIGPGQSLLIYTWIQCTTYSTGTTWLPELGWWER